MLTTTDPGVPTAKLLPRSALGDRLSELRNRRTQAHSRRTAQRICHGDSAAGLQTDVIRQIRIVQRLSRQSLSPRHTSKSRNRQCRHVHQSQQLQPDRAGDASAQSVVLRRRFLQRLRIHWIQPGKWRDHLPIKYNVPFRAFPFAPMSPFALSAW